MSALRARRTRIFVFGATTVVGLMSVSPKVALAARGVVIADLGPHPPGVCDDKHEGEACRVGGGPGTCLRRTERRHITLVCTPAPTQSPDPPPIPTPPTTASLGPLNFPPPGGSAPPEASSGSCKCNTATEGDAPLAGLASTFAALAVLARRRLTASR